MLPQRAALEDSSADTPKGGNETGTIRTLTRARRDTTLPRGDTPTSPVDVRHTEASSQEPASVEGREARPQGRSTASSRREHVHVFVLDKNGKPLDPCHPARARKLLAKGRAVVVNMTPFVIRVKDRTVEESEVMGVNVFVDPGSKTTGIAVARVDDENVRHVTHLFELEHRGGLISKKLKQRSNYRRRRRSSNLRYRAPRYSNRTKPKGWLAPSLQHRMDTTMSIVERVQRYASVVGIWQELVRFDTQQLQNPEISGTEYQHGELAGYEVREYLLAKWNRTCAYCDITDVPLNIDHIVPKAAGGSNRVSNLTLACISCNQKKDKTLIETFLAHDPVRLGRILKHTKTPLRDAAAVNSTRWALWRALTALNVPVRTGSGGQTKYNRTRFGLPKTHALDAACVGHPNVVTGITGTGMPTLLITATGRGQYARTTPDKYGFPRLIRTRTKVHYGYQTGDLVRAIIPAGKHTGNHTGRIAVRTHGTFALTTKNGRIDVHHRHLTLIQRANGYGYQTRSS